MEKIPAPDNLYDESGRVKDPNVAEDMAGVEQYYRDVDEDRLFRPRKKELAEREADLNSVGHNVLANQQQSLESHKSWEAHKQAERVRREEFIERNLLQSGLPRENWLALTSDQQGHIERGWKRAEQQSSEFLLERRLNSLVGRKVISFDVGESGEISLRFDDEFVLSFQSWNMIDDSPGYDGVKVKKANDQNRPN